MSEMVERVAKAITKAFEAEWRVFDDGQAEDLARAAIEAMRTPTKAMWVASSHENGYVTEAAWLAMIDAALTGTKPETRSENRP